MKRKCADRDEELLDISVKTIRIGYEDEEKESVHYIRDANTVLVPRDLLVQCREQLFLCQPTAQAFQLRSALKMHRDLVECLRSCSQFLGVNQEAQERLVMMTGEYYEDALTLAYCKNSIEKIFGRLRWVAESPFRNAYKLFCAIRDSLKVFLDTLSAEDALFATQMHKILDTREAEDTAKAFRFSNRAGGSETERRLAENSAELVLRSTPDHENLHTIVSEKVEAFATVCMKLSTPSAYYSELQKSLVNVCKKLADADEVLSGTRVRMSRTFVRMICCHVRDSIIASGVYARSKHGNYAVLSKACSDLREIAVYFEKGSNGENRDSKYFSKLIAQTNKTLQNFARWTFSGLKSSRLFRSHLFCVQRNDCVTLPSVQAAATSSALLLNSGTLQPGNYPCEAVFCDEHAKLKAFYRALPVDGPFGELVAVEGQRAIKTDKRRVCFLQYKHYSCVKHASNEMKPLQKHLQIGHSFRSSKTPHTAFSSGIGGARSSYSGEQLTYATVIESVRQIVCAVALLEGVSESKLDILSQFDVCDIKVDPFGRLCFVPGNTSGRRRADLTWSFEGAAASGNRKAVLHRLMRGAAALLAEGLCEDGSFCINRAESFDPFAVPKRTRFGLLMPINAVDFMRSAFNYEASAASLCSHALFCESTAASDPNRSLACDSDLVHTNNTYLDWQVNNVDIINSGKPRIFLRGHDVSKVSQDSVFSQNVRNGQPAKHFGILIRSIASMSQHYSYGLPLDILTAGYWPQSIDLSRRKNGVTLQCLSASLPLMSKTMHMQPGGVFFCRRRRDALASGNLNAITLFECSSARFAHREHALCHTCMGSAHVSKLFVQLHDKLHLKEERERRQRRSQQREQEVAQGPLDAEMLPTLIEALNVAVNTDRFLLFLVEGFVESQTSVSGVYLAVCEEISRISGNSMHVARRVFRQVQGLVDLPSPLNRLVQVIATAESRELSETGRGLARSLLRDFDDSIRDADSQSEERCAIPPCFEKDPQHLDTVFAMVSLFRSVHVKEVTSWGLFMHRPLHFRNSMQTGVGSGVTNSIWADFWHELFEKHRLFERQADCYYSLRESNRMAPGADRCPACEKHARSLGCDEFLSCELSSENFMRCLGKIFLYCMVNEIYIPYHLHPSLLHLMLCPSDLTNVLQRQQVDRSSMLLDLQRMIEPEATNNFLKLRSDGTSDVEELAVEFQWASQNVDLRESNMPALLRSKAYSLASMKWESRNIWSACVKAFHCVPMHAILRAVCGRGDNCVAVEAFASILHGSEYGTAKAISAKDMYATTSVRMTGFEESYYDGMLRTILNHSIAACRTNGVDLDGSIRNRVYPSLFELYISSASSLGVTDVNEERDILKHTRVAHEEEVPHVLLCLPDCNSEESSIRDFVRSIVADFVEHAHKVRKNARYAEQVDKIEAILDDESENSEILCCLHFLEAFLGQCTVVWDLAYVAIGGGDDEASGIAHSAIIQYFGRLLTVSFTLIDMLKMNTFLYWRRWLLEESSAEERGQILYMATASRVLPETAKSLVDSENLFSKQGTLRSANETLGEALSNAYGREVQAERMRLQDLFRWNASFNQICAGLRVPALSKSVAKDVLKNAEENHTISLFSAEPAQRSALRVFIQAMQLSGKTFDLEVHAKHHFSQLAAKSVQRLFDLRRNTQDEHVSRTHRRLNSLGTLAVFKKSTLNRLPEFSSCDKSMRLYLYSSYEKFKSCMQTSLHASSAGFHLL